MEMARYARLIRGEFQSNGEWRRTAGYELEETIQDAEHCDRNK